MNVLPLLLLSCSEYGVTGKADPELGAAPVLRIDPDTYDFGTLEPAATSSLAVNLHNDGNATLTISALAYEGSSVDLRFDPEELDNGPLPWAIEPGGLIATRVDYIPRDDGSDSGTLTVSSDDPGRPEATAVQFGAARSFEGFSGGWYIVDDSTNFETTSNPSYVVEDYGDVDGYWYEPSGAHGMIDSVDIEGDFAILHDYIMARAGAPTPVTGPLNFNTMSTVPTFSYASYSYVLCDFWLDETDDPSLYEISAGNVDDGILVIVNGEILGAAVLGFGGRWSLEHAVAGQVNSLVVILMDNSAKNKFVTDLAFYRDGVMVTGE